jgi:hypothetical protein
MRSTNVIATSAQPSALSKASGTIRADRNHADLVVIGPFTLKNIQGVLQLPSSHCEAQG